MRTTSASSSADQSIKAMSWHRRRIRRARRRNQDSAPAATIRLAAPEPFTPPAPEARRPLIRRLVVFVPPKQRRPKPAAPAAVVGESGAVPRPA